MKKKIITSTFGVPADKHGWSQGYKVGDTAYISGQFSQDSGGNLMYADDIAGQTQKALENLDRALKALGLEMENLAMVKILLVNLRETHKPASKLFTAYHAGHSPAVTLYGVTALSLPEQLIEISAIACE